MWGTLTKACGFNICPVFWLILLALLQDTATDQEKPKRKLHASSSLWEAYFSLKPVVEDRNPFVSINDLRFLKGEIYVNKSDELFLALDNIHFAYMKKGYLWTHKTTLIVEERPFEWDSPLFRMKFKKAIDIPNTYNMARAVALAWRLGGRHLPYWYVHCNEWHYMGYILLGGMPECPTEMCPLMRPVDKMWAWQIESRPFVLRNWRGEDVITFP